MTHMAIIRQWFSLSWLPQTLYKVEGNPAVCTSLTIAHILLFQWLRWPFYYGVRVGHDHSAEIKLFPISSVATIPLCIDTDKRTSSYASIITINAVLGSNSNTTRIQPLPLHTLSLSLLSVSFSHVPLSVQRFLFVIVSLGCTELSKSRSKRKSEWAERNRQTAVSAVRNREGRCIL